MLTVALELILWSFAVGACNDVQYTQNDEQTECASGYFVRARTSTQVWTPRWVRARRVRSERGSTRSEAQLLSWGSVVVQTKHQNGEELWSDWLWPWKDCWCQTGLFEYIRNCSRFYSDGTKHTKKHRVSASSWEQKCHVNERGQGRRARLLPAARKVILTQISTDLPYLGVVYLMLFGA